MSRQDHPHAAFAAAAHLAPPSAHATSHSRTRSGANSPTPSHQSHRSGVHAHVGNHHYHSQHTDVFVPSDSLGGVEVTDVLVADANQQAEDAVSDDEDDVSERGMISVDHTGERRRSVTWVDIKGSSRPGMVKTMSGRSVEGYRDEGEAEVEEVESSGSSGPAEGRGDPMSDSENWALIRDGSISRRPAWRRPHPYWLFPVLVPVALSMAMTMAPKQELFINLACLAHPPHTEFTSYSTLDMASAIWNAPTSTSQSQTGYQEFHSPDASNTTFSTLPHGSILGLTPADKWMLDVQRRIAADAKRRRLANNETEVDGPPLVITPGNGPVQDQPLPTPPNRNESHTTPSPDRSQPADDGPRPGEIDPRVCKKDPRVQAAAAKLQMTMTLCMGILSATTTAFWGGMSDRYGRTRILAIAIFGIFMNELILILTASYPYLVPGGYRFLILGPIFDGSFGGLSTFMATYHAYVSDSTPDGSRARMFSTMSGVMMCGMAFGPVIGAMVITLTGSILSVFYVAACVSGSFALFALLMLPESLSSDARLALKSAGQAKALRRMQKEQAERDWENDTSQITAGDSGWSRMSGASTSSNTNKKMKGQLRRFRRRFFAFLNPLGIFIPKEREMVDSTGNSVLRKDWNLTFLALTAFTASSLMGMMQLKSQYLIFSYGWTSAQLGPYMTAALGMRSFVLLVLLPVVFRYLKPKVKTTGPSHPNATGVFRSAQALADAQFDLLVMRVSLGLDFFVYTALAFALPQELFVILSLAVAFGSGLNAAQNSLALNLIDSSKEAGRLFGALAVSQAMSSTFLGPLVFSNLYAATVGTYAPAMFGVGALFILVAQLWLSGVRLPSQLPKADPERGRTRRVKRVKSSSQNGSGIQGQSSFGQIEESESTR